MMMDILPRLQGVRRAGRGWIARCPAHEDRQASLSVARRDNAWLVNCFAGCSFESILDALQLEARDLFDTENGGGGRFAPGPTAQPCNRATGLTVEQYAEAKALPVDFLKSCGISDFSSSGAPVVRIPYFGPDGEVLAVRFRIGLDGDRFRWKTGSKPLLYGLNRLAEARHAGHVVLVEGESDCHTLWHHGMPAIGIPGAANWREDLDARRLDDIGTIYVVIEPDRGGETVHQWLARSRIRDRVKLIRLPAKDPSALHLEDPHQFLQRWNTACLEALPWAAIEGKAKAEDRVEKPRLLVEPCDPDRTVAALRDVLSTAGGLYDRGGPVQLVFDQLQRATIAQTLTPDLLILKAHSICRPYALKQQRDGTIIEVNARLPRPFATMYLEWRGEWRLPLLNGVASAPLLSEGGMIQCAEGYDSNTCLWQEHMPDLSGLVPEHPTERDAATALGLLRDTFKTFCFADAETILDENGTAVVDIRRPPGNDESAFLTACLTAVCRPSLDLAPGVLLRAAPISGAGAGKGLLARCICVIAFGREPHAVTGGSNSEELEKRIAAELIEGNPALYLDNLNNTALKSDLLASVITERPARVRILGRSQMVTLNASAFVILTGNGLTVSEDLARRFIAVDFDPRTEDPEARSFKIDIRAEVHRRRTELLAAVLTIWRWGRLSQHLTTGRPLGSFEQWCQWVRDPLVALGCADPAARVGEAKERDGRRQVITDLFQSWWVRHQDQPMLARDLAEEVRSIADPQGRGRQFLVSYLEKLVNTRMAGFMLTRQAAAGKWGVATYALRRIETADPHRGHRGHRSEDSKFDLMSPGTNGQPSSISAPMPPMVPMPSSSSAQPVAEEDAWGMKI